MKLTTEQIISIVCGAVRTCEEDGLVRLFRFTEEQEALYKTVSPEFYAKSLSSAGMRLSFRTDSQQLFLKVVTGQGSSRSFFSYDVFVNGEAVGYLDNYSRAPMTEDYTKATFPLGEFSETFALGDGTKTVTVFLPWSVCTAIRELWLDDGSFIEPVRPKKKVLIFGDSITQGYDALRPSRRYASVLANALEAEEISKAIGGEVFRPELAQLPDDFQPDYITVAYGTNDWSKTEQAACLKNSRNFYQTLSTRYPAARIFALTPIWRADYQEIRPFGPFALAEEVIREATADLPNITVIRGFDFLPKDIAFFSDKRVHPNDEGFDFYAKKLCAAIRAEL